jgi:hypothetical protein
MNWIAPSVDAGCEGPAGPPISVHPSSIQDSRIERQRCSLGMGDAIELEKAKMFLCKASSLSLSMTGRLSTFMFL